MLNYSDEKLWELLNGIAPSCDFAKSSDIENTLFRFISFDIFNKYQLVLDKLASDKRPWLKNIHRTRAWDYPFTLCNLKYKKGAKLLDAGCGFSPLTPFLADLGFDVYGVDETINLQLLPNESYFNDSKEGTIIDVWGKRDNLKYIHGNMGNLNFENNYFDVVICVSVLEHIHPLSYIKTIVNEFARVVKPGGQVILVIDFVYSDHFIKTRKGENVTQIDYKEIALCDERLSVVGGFNEKLPGGKDYDEKSLKSAGVYFVNLYGHDESSIGIILEKKSL